ncbi:hypothetical protein [Novosphingobium mangrovi (ex Huang et al. 2023)]|uniref:Flagellar hook-length control protein-like C-terminal domain-containing protein n=1 Tax=Novosphingobium mangrovi (ex Huang et al. 2023) TaxID=2976432 RepID=A0ABT2I054_9SPHN|nr:hypothetical protein [Novosphingobium mangrovi (ex Huang et al. 2023)]MCT2398174.1 hypothetical protein [Novosphingobium mangrovi (ex Huang et al. 2023)]
MIQSAAPTPSASSVLAVGKVHGASANGAEKASFSAIFDASGNSDTAIAQALPDGDSALAALLASVAGGNAGKAGGKILPDSGKEPSADTESDADAASPDAMPDASSLPLALAEFLSVPQPARATTTDQIRATGSDVAAAAGKLSRVPTGTGAVLAPAAKAAAVAAPAANGTVPATSVVATGTENAPAAPAVTLAPIELVAEETTRAAGDAQPLAAARTTAPEAATPTTVQLATRAPLAPAAQGEDTIQDAPARSQATRQHPARTAEARTDADAIKLASPQTQGQTAGATPLPLVTQPAHLQAAATPATHLAAGAIPATQPAEGPQDFTTLVSRLAEAREAASPHLVRTAINHAEFGQISLQFRHEDKALSVTMANSDPGFAGAVHAAANASLSSNASGNDNGNDTSRQQQQQQSQNNSASSQQQASAAGTGTGSGTGHNQQARADQAGHSMNRGQGSSSLPHDQEASAPRQTRDGTRSGSGIYA